MKIKIYIENNTNADTIRGDFHFSAPSRLFLEVTYPLHQIMLIEKNITLIFYPEKSKAFRFESVNPVKLPLVTGLIATARPDFGMKDYGLQLMEQKVIGDTIFSYWSHPQVRDRIGDYTIAEVDEHLVYSFYSSPDKSHFSKTLFEEHQYTFGFNLPTIIRSEIRVNHVDALEIVYLADLQINKPLPDGIINFQLPNGINVVEKEW